MSNVLTEHVVVSFMSGRVIQGLCFKSKKGGSKQGRKTCET